jgi:hypothetical protein
MKQTQDCVKDSPLFAGLMLLLHIDYPDQTDLLASLNMLKLNTNYEN